MDLKSIKSGQNSYKFSYSIDYDTNDFCIEFYDKNGNQCYENSCPIFLLKKFKSFDVNNKYLTIMKQCDTCSKYWYSSSNFTLDYKTTNLGDLRINNEHSIFFKPHYNEYKMYTLISFYELDRSLIYLRTLSEDHYSLIQSKNSLPSFYGDLTQTNTITFNKSPDVMIEKLNTLITFS